MYIYIYYRDYIGVLLGFYRGIYWDDHIGVI